MTTPPTDAIREVIESYAVSLPISSMTIPEIPRRGASEARTQLQALLDDNKRLRNIVMQWEYQHDNCLVDKPSKDGIEGVYEW